MTDPFGTRELRAAVLDAWRASPARFREDANTEEDHARGYYRDRVVVELAQNAADAAARSGAPGHLHLTFRRRDDGHHTLVASNTGQPLDAAGVASLASMRASAKRAAPDHRAPATVGRFGVGFSAVRAVSDDVTLATAEGAVRFSLAGTRDALAGLLGTEGTGDAEVTLAAEVAARGDSLPVLRLPHGGPPAPVPHGFATTIELVLRDDAAVASVRDQLRAVDDALLLALPALAEVRLDDEGDVRSVRDVPARWVSVTRTGDVPAELLEDRPVEERTATRWSVTWAVPRPSMGGAVPGVVHAPTPTDEPLTLPALLVATFPLDPSRRHVADDALARYVTRHAASAYADLVPHVPDPLHLVPTGLPSGRLDAALHEGVLDALAGAPLVGGRRPADVVAVPGASPGLVAALAPTGLGVVALDRRHTAAARVLGIRTWTLPDVVDALPDGLAPASWRGVYAALAPDVDSSRELREALGGVLVPLADGTTARGPRGLVLPGDALAGAEDLALLGARVVHPDAAHPLLEALGAVRADGPAVLDLPALETVVRDADDLLDARPSDDDAWPEEIEALLRVVGRALRGDPLRDPAPGAGRPAWFADIPVPCDDDRWSPVGETALAGSWAAQHLDLPVVVVPDGWWAPGERLLGALGARSDLVVVRHEHVTGGPDLDVAGWADYDASLCAALGRGEDVGEVALVADLDVVHDDAWGAVVERIVADPTLRGALLGPVRPVGRAGHEAVSYTAWFLRDVLGAPFSDRPGWTALPAVPPELRGVEDTAVLVALGAVRDETGLRDLLVAADPDVWDVVLDGLPDAGTALPLDLALAVWEALRSAAAAGVKIDAGRVPALRAGGARVADRDEAVVAWQPMWSQVRTVVPVPDASAADVVAEALDVPSTEDVSVTLQGGDVTTERQVPEAVRTAVPGLPGRWTEHDALAVDGTEVDWWVTADGGAHVRDASPGAHGAPLRCVAAALAQAAGRWADRYVVEVLLGDPARARDVAAGEAWDAAPAARPGTPQGPGDAGGGQPKFS
ncbi:sacsin N-terminal ATP-binding-like domain-containing protein [Sanguibacter suaedae]|uniref:ATP-binding protein n=1 Tax=Sanguibacter suaedae TaxID=2795737 RepID=A0A934I7F7_9MICO|nr:ATP-binding protein [Sanguibacter suaedae]MBI9114557.1 ATP-binding protein [Sanguibacter suaedae]